MKPLLPYIALLLFGLQLLLMLGSWLLSAAVPDSGVCSLLSGEGLRWFMSNFANMLASPILVWLLLLAMAYGVLRHSRLLQVGKTYRERRARLMTLLLLSAYITVVCLLTFTPHAVLLSATGRLWPSPFSQSLVPLASFGIMLTSTFYGMVSGHLPTLRDVYNALLDGLRRSAPLFLFYILFTQLYESFRFAFL